MNLYDSIYLRKSIRTYRMEVVETEILHYITKFTEHLEALGSSQRIHFDLISNADNHIKRRDPFEVKAPYYLVVSAVPCENYLMNAGFMAQQVMLYLLTKGLGTCFLRYRPMEIVPADGYEPVVMLAFGRTDKNLYREAKKAKRFSMEEISVMKTPVSEEMRLILNAGRLAPSSFNSQPWRFVVYDNRIHLFSKKERFVTQETKKLHRLDVGIALANLYLAAEELWYQCDFLISENISDHSFKKNEYLLTMVVTK